MRTSRRSLPDLGPVQAREFMKLALNLASRGRGKTSPNPMVGAVIVRGGRIVATGCHRCLGAPHAEAAALKKAGKRARGGVLFVNLEPCCHYGLTPPCVSRIVESGIKTVFASIVDPDARVNGKGFRFLRKHGVAVNVGFLQREARKLNEAYLKWAREKRPFVAIKLCESLDGRITASDGRSHGLGSPEEIKFAHSLRARYDAVLVGVGTVINDNPRLTVRKVRGTHPHRIVLDSRLRLPLASNVIKPAGEEKVIVAAARDVRKAKIETLRSKGVEVWLLPEKNGDVSLKGLLSKAGFHAIQSILVEGGGDVITSFLKEKLADKIYVAIAPKILGGTSSVFWAKEIGVRAVPEAIQLNEVRVRRLGTDLLVEGYL